MALQGAGYNADPMHAGKDSPILRRLLVPGEAHGSEVFAKSGERWLSLTRGAAGYRTDLATLKITLVPDSVAGFDVDGKPTAKKVATEGAGDPVFLLKGFEHLAGRAIRTAFDGSFDLGPHTRSSLYLGDRGVELQVLPSGKTDEFPPGEKVPIFQVCVMRGEAAFPLPLVVTNYNQVRLRWAGDLDGDNRVDFLFEDSGYNWSSHRLFLSSAAKTGELAAEVGQFLTTGC